MKGKSLLFATLLLTTSQVMFAELPAEYSLKVPPTENVYLNDTPNGEWGMGVVQWSIHVDKVNIDRELTEVVSLYRDGQLLRTLSPASDTEINLNSVMGTANIDGSDDLIDFGINHQVQFNFARENEDGTAENTPDPEFLISGVYKLVVPAGLFYVRGENDNIIRLPGAEVTYNYTNEIQKSSPYIITPTPGTVTEDITEITITFPDAKNPNTFDYQSNGGATFMFVPEGTDDEATKLPGGTYPQINFSEKSFTYKFKSSNIKWEDGTYTFTIKANELSIDNVLFEEPITAVYILDKDSSLAGGTIPEDNLPAEYSLKVPPTEIVYLNDTPNGEWGMGVVQWSIHVDKVNIDRELTEVVSLYRDGQLLRTLSPASDTEINLNSVMGTANIDGSDDLIDFGINHQVQFNFARENEDGTAENTPDPEFLISGVYKLVVPAGLFYVRGENDNIIRLPGAEVTYNYTNEIQKSSPYIITPTPGTVTEDITEITITFPDAKNPNTFDYQSNGGATFMFVPEGTDDEATKLPGGTYPQINFSEKSFTYKFKSSNIKWEDGTYTFTIKANELSIDNVLFEEPITAVYILDKDSSLAGGETITDGIKVPNGEDTVVKTVQDEEWGEYIEISTRALPDENVVNITFEIPKGYDTMLYMNYGTMISKLSKVSVDELLDSGYEEGNVISVKPGTINNMYAIMFAKDGEADQDSAYRTFITVDYPTGVANIVTVENCDVYSITGVKVASDGNIANLPAGLYIVNGKKVLVK